MGYARDGRPLVGWLDAAHHLAICAGFTGHGMGLAAACTQDLAELLSWKRAAGIGTFDPQRFPELRQVREGIVDAGVDREELTAALRQALPENAARPTDERVAGCARHSEA